METITVVYNDMYFKLSKHEIDNFFIIIKSLYPGICIDSLVIDNLILSLDEEFIYIGDSFIMRTSRLIDLITIFKQSQALRLRLLRPKAPTSGSGTKVTNLG